MFFFLKSDFAYKTVSTFNIMGLFFYFRVWRYHHISFAKSVLYNYGRLNLKLPAACLLWKDLKHIIEYRFVKY